MSKARLTFGFGTRIAFGLTVGVLILSVCCVHAIDPLPPELEKAPLEKQLAWRERLGRESASDKKLVAERRHEQRTAVKRRMVAQFHAEAAQRRLDVVGPSVHSMPLVDSGIAKPNELRWLAIVSGVVLTVYLVRRSFSPPESAGS